MTVYAPRCTVHPDRMGVRKSNPNRLLVLHTSEGGELASSAEALCSFMGQPGDRVTSSGGRYGSSYHAVFDTDCVRPAVPDHTVAYSAAGANHDGVHGCFPGKAGQSEAQWLDVNSRAMIGQAAAWLVDESTLHNIPLVRLTWEQVRDGASGVCDHYDVSRAFRRSDHTDVGAGFPWDVLFADVRALLAPVPEIPEEMEMEPPYVIVPSGAWAKPWFPWLLVPTASREAVVTVTGEAPTTAQKLTCTDEGQYRRRCHQACVQLAVEAP